MGGSLRSERERYGPRGAAVRVRESNRCRNEKHSRPDLVEPAQVFDEADAAPQQHVVSNELLGPGSFARDGASNRVVLRKIEADGPRVTIV